jgi:hypothetical protein
VVTVQVDREYVSFRFEGTQSFLALKSTVKIPLMNIDEVSIDTASAPHVCLGKVGSRVPPFFWAGTFWTTTGKKFYYIRDRSKCVTLKLKNHEYAEVVVEVDDKQSIAEKIRKMIKNN